MAEESSKGIALVILGIVAVIAIVGLVLLFTGAKKATGEFAVPAAKVYGGAIKGVGTPYDRAFAGRTYNVPTVTYPSGQPGVYAGQATKKVAFTTYGEDPGQRTVQNYAGKSWERDMSQVFSSSCEQLSYASFANHLAYPVDASVQEYNSYGPMNCLMLQDFMAFGTDVLAGKYGITPNQARLVKDWANAHHKSALACCKMPSDRTGGIVYGAI